MQQCCNTIKYEDVIGSKFPHAAACKFLTGIDNVNFCKYVLTFPAPKLGIFLTFLDLCFDFLANNRIYFDL